jgi:hypothetical protein
MFVEQEKDEELTPAEVASALGDFLESADSLKDKLSEFQGYSSYEQGKALELEMFSHLDEACEIARRLRDQQL